MHVNLIFCAFCGSQHEAGKEFCKAANAQCYRCGKLSHLWRMCHSQCDLWVNSTYDFETKLEF